MNLPENPSDLQRPRPHSAGETKLVEVKADRVDLPPSIAGNAFHSLLYGPMAGQPSKATADEGARRSSFVFWALLLLALFCLYTFRNTDPGPADHPPPPPPKPAWP